MTEPQVWTLTGVFATAVFGMLTLMSTMFVQLLNAGFAGLRVEMNATFEGVDTKLDHLDRDAHALARQVFPGRE